jgi:hypothetical protein
MGYGRRRSSEACVTTTKLNQLGCITDLITTNDPVAGQARGNSFAGKVGAGGKDPLSRKEAGRTNALIILIYTLLETVSRCPNHYRKSTVFIFSREDAEICGGE